METNYHYGILNRTLVNFYMKTFILNNLSGLLLFMCFTCIPIYAQSDPIVPAFEYEETLLPPINPSSASDTILDMYIVLDAVSLEKIETVVLIVNDKEYTYPVKDILQDATLFNKEENKVYLKICKATDPVSFYVLGATPENTSQPFVKALTDWEKRVLESESIKPVEFERKYDVKTKR